MERGLAFSKLTNFEKGDPRFSTVLLAGFRAKIGGFLRDAASTAIGGLRTTAEGPVSEQERAKARGQGCAIRAHNSRSAPFQEGRPPQPAKISRNRTPCHAENFSARINRNQTGNVE
jgi:hypothetical protein